MVVKKLEGDIMYDKLNLDDAVFDCYCYVEHMDFLTVEEQHVSSIFGELELF